MFVGSFFFCGQCVNVCNLAFSSQFINFFSSSRFLFVAFLSYLPLFVSFSLPFSFLAPFLAYCLCYLFHGLYFFPCASFFMTVFHFYYFTLFSLYLSLSVKGFLSKSGMREVHLFFPRNNGWPLTCGCLDRRLASRFTNTLVGPHTLSGSSLHYYHNTWTPAPPSVPSTTHHIQMGIVPTASGRFPQTERRNRVIVVLLHGGKHIIM